MFEQGPRNSVTRIKPSLCVNPMDEPECSNRLLCCQGSEASGEGGVRGKDPSAKVRGHPRFFQS